MRIGSLFSGIGGLELGLERAGLGHTVWQVEIDPFCRSVLRKHWPGVHQHEDVCTAGAANLEPVDIICGGFPCQDVSAAGKGAGIKEGTRSGLWLEFARVIRELAPRLVVVENVASGARRWLPRVRRDLHMLGYGTRAFALSAADVGAPHLRRRIFVVADAQQQQLREQSGGRGGQGREGAPFAGLDGTPRDVAYAMSAGRKGAKAHAGGVRLTPGTRWASEPDVDRVVHGLSTRLDGRFRRARLRALGNAVVPECAEAVGRMILAGDV